MQEGHTYLICSPTVASRCNSLKYQHLEAFLPGGHEPDTIPPKQHKCSMD